MILVILAGVAVLSWPKHNSIVEGSALVNGQIIHLEIADTWPKQIQGLSGRQTMPENYGMLFIYPQYQLQNFWMKDMHFPLDFLWIKDDTIVGVLTDIPPSMDQPLPTYQSPEPVNFVLELNAGIVKKFNIKIGDTILLRY